MSRKEIVSDWFYQYNHDVYNFLVYYTGKRDPEDLVQEVFIKAIKGLDKFDGKSSPKTWLFSIARNVAIDDIRKNKRRGMDQNVDLDEAYNVGHHVTPDAIVQEDEEKQQLYRAINSLKSNYREVIILRAIKELNVSETASVLNWSNQKVRTTYSRALKALGEVQGGFQNE
ncbi:RNA polymerase sigma factor [Alkalibacillus haloalkaliphilus]|uniref:RNA polymerase sigma factor SigX n=1 Tax=Alkalibacillus haloalkaliphilus TaxID=94136 RepID=A0A511W389_9BACI|nr:RNA polymerase sigma factor [Alkalibacillus haloalkaliphilus]GEN45556.1 RNA polymerase sigma factor SigX [Alkalibacillus haloalkaliphilus]